MVVHSKQARDFEIRLNPTVNSDEIHADVTNHFYLDSTVEVMLKSMVETRLNTRVKSG